MGGTAAGRMTTAGSGIDGVTLGASGGAQNATISQANLPAVTLSVDIPAGQGFHNHGVNLSGTPAFIIGAGQSGGEPARLAGSGSISINGATLPAMSGSAALGGSGTPLVIAQPSIILNKIIRVSYDG